MACTPEFTERQIITAMLSSGGRVATVAKTLGVWPSTVYRYIEVYPNVRNAWQTYREELLDEAEERLIMLMRDSPQEIEFKATTFILSRLGRSRGWSERIDMDLTSGGQQMPAQVVYIVRADGSYIDRDGVERNVRDTPILPETT